jgi:hypothetical protein
VIHFPLIWIVVPESFLYEIKEQYQTQRARELQNRKRGIKLISDDEWRNQSTHLEKQSDDRQDFCKVADIPKK